MRHRQKIIDNYPADTDLRVLAVSFRCAPQEYALLARAADQCSKSLGAYVRDEVVSLHQDLAVRPKKEDQHQRLVEVLRVLGDRLKCVHQDLRRDYESRRPLSDISAAEIYGITQRCRLALARVDESMGSATSKRPPPYHPARPTGDEVAATVPTDEPAAQLVKAPVAPSSASPAKPPLDASPPLPRDVVIPVDRDRVP